MCVFSSHPFWTSSSLDVPAGVTQEEGHTGFLIHLPSAVRALIFVARRIQPFLSLVDREYRIQISTFCASFLCATQRRRKNRKRKTEKHKRRQRCPWLLHKEIARYSLVSRDGFGSPVLRKPAHLDSQAESGV